MDPAEDIRVALPRKMIEDVERNDRIERCRREVQRLDVAMDELRAGNIAPRQLDLSS